MGLAGDQRKRLFGVRVVHVGLVRELRALLDEVLTSSAHARAARGVPVEA
jgi:hypothetical protein